MGPAFPSTTTTPSQCCLQITDNSSIAGTKLQPGMADRWVMRL
jgi:hypothetical protein